MTVSFLLLATEWPRAHAWVMAQGSDKVNFSGQLLVAMPGMGDPRFEHAVIFMCAHSEEGAMGLIVNKPSQDLSFADLIEQLSIEMEGEAAGTPIHFGGPVEHGRGFVLHTADYASDQSTLEVEGGFGMTATLDVLEDIAKGEGPEAAILALGYSGWGPGQLEGEIQQNGWLLCKATSSIVFDVPNGSKWAAALKTLGVDPLTLSATAGRA